MSASNALARVIPSDPVYLEAQARFKQGWVNPQKGFPTIRGIYEVEFRTPDARNHLQQYSSYVSQLLGRNPGSSVEYALFQGTTRACAVGDVNSALLYPCTLPQCAVCHILRCDFTGNHAKKFGYWGSGIYTTAASNKADYFSRNENSPYKVVLLSKVAVGKRSLLTEKDTTLKGPPVGFDSVDAVTEQHGGVVKYSEVVVYRDDAMCPWVMVSYSI